MGLSAWKTAGNSRWALRVNPSSGNLHPTETYLVRDGCVSHYVPRDHALEERAVLDGDTWRTVFGEREAFLVALTSIQWREAWKYGERAFRYCQHDVGHAIAALRFSAALFGWTMRLLPGWSDAQLATLLGVDRDPDDEDAEREQPECLAVVGRAPFPADVDEPDRLVAAARAAVWQGTANVLSLRHVEWPIIDRVTDSTVYAGRVNRAVFTESPGLTMPAYSRELLLRRRSAVAFDARTSLPRERFQAMLSRLQGGGAPWDAIDWAPHVHLALFVHRVEGLTPGIYAYLRDPAVVGEWRSAMRPEFLWEAVSEPGGPSDGRLFLLVPTDVTWVGTRVSCDQDIAGAGFFSLGMIARLESSLKTYGEWFYRRLFWECGMIGQVLYLEAEAAGARGTGIGCFYDNAVHQLLGLSGREWQSLYHFSMGMPVDDPRLTTEPGYGWEK